MNEKELEYEVITPKVIDDIQKRNVQDAKVCCEKLGLIYDQETGEDKRTKLRWSDFRTIMYALAHGDSMQKVADYLNLSVTTIYAFFMKNPDSLDDIDEARNYFNFNVEQSIYKQAIGYYYEDEVAAFSPQSGWQTTTVRKFKPPSFEATRFYLTNRRGNKWKNLKSIDLSINEMSDDEIVREARNLLDYERNKDDRGN